MVSLWGSSTKNSEDEEHENGDTTQDGEESRQPSRQRQRPDERTRLLPPRNDGYLDPDDPAVIIFLHPVEVSSY